MTPLPRFFASPLAATDAAAASATTPVAVEAARLVEQINRGELDQAMQRFRELLGSDNPAIPTNDASSYASQLMTQVGMQMQMRQHVMTTFPREMDKIKQNMR